MEFPAPVLEGRWVRLEPLTEEHREGLRSAAADPRIWQFLALGGPGPAFDPVFDDALEQLAAGKRKPYAARLRATGELVGATAYVDPLPAHKRVEVGWTWYRTDQWATAVNPECKLLLLTHAFEHLGLNRVQFMVDRLNERSQAAVTKLGATREGLLRCHAIVRDGRIRDTVVFSVIAADWPAVKARLEERLARFAHG